LAALLNSDFTVQTQCDVNIAHAGLYGSWQVV